MENFLALIIEDEADLASIFSEAMQVAGFETIIIEDGQQALDRLRELIPHIIVLDLHLPGVDGHKVLNYIRSDERLSHTRVMIASADAAFAKTLENQADFTLLKPISFSQLRDLACRLRTSFTQA